MDWQLIVALVVGIPIVIFVPFLVWAAAASGLLQVLADTARRRAAARRRVARPVVQPVREG